MGVATAALLLSAKGIEATKMTNGEGNQVTELAGRMQRAVYQNRVGELDFSPQQIEQARRWYGKRGLPFDPPPDDVQGISREGASQPAEKPSSSQRDQGFHVNRKVKIPGLSDKIPSRMGTPEREIPQSTKKIHQEEQLSLTEQQVQVLHAVEQKARENPAFRESVRLLVEETRRRLNNPPSYQCLDTGQSKFFSAGVIPVTDPSGLAYQGTLEPSVTNTCGVEMDSTQFTYTVSFKCPAGSSGKPLTETIPGPSSVSDGRTVPSSTGVELTSECLVLENGVPVSSLPPTIVDVGVTAHGQDASGKRYLPTKPTIWSVKP